jgi:Fe-Mn family superoxide dismutase
MAFSLPELPYAYNALEPHIDARTMEIHHTKHHQAYINNLNNAIKGTPMESMSLEEILAQGADKLSPAVRNNGGGHANHGLFWQIMGPGGGAPGGALASAINSTFGSFDALKEKFSSNGGTRFGSGWSWLVVKGDGSLDAYSTPNQDSPLMTGDTPILGLDVWEHAYYLNYQNRRPDYIAAWWNVVNWGKVAELYQAAKG